MSILESGYEQWRTNAAEQQQELFRNLGDRIWDEVEIEPKISLQTKFSFALYSSYYHQLPLEDKSIVDATLNKVLEINGSNTRILIGFVYVSVCIKETRKSCIVPIVRTRGKYSDTEYFIEQQPGRIYNGWSDYEENNKLPESFMCFPVDGKYKGENGRVIVKYRESPSCDITFKVIDIIAGVGNLALSGVLAASVFFPLMLPVTVGVGIALGTTTAYSTGRSISHLVDRGTHDESISLDDAEARSIWINMLTNIVGGVMVGGAAVVPRLVAAGRISSTAVISAMEILSYASIAINSFGIVTCVVTLIFKFRNGTLCSADIDKFISACLFFANITLTVSLAGHIIETFSKQPSRMVNLFHMVKNTTYQTIKNAVCAVEVGVGMILEIISGPVPVMVLRYFNMNATARIVETVISTFRRFARNAIGPFEMLTEFYRLGLNSIDQFRHEIQMAVQTIQKYFNQTLEYITINKKHLFAGSSRMAVLEVVSEICKPVENIQTNSETVEDTCTRMILKLSEKFAESVNCQTGQEFVHLCSFLSNKIINDCDKRLIMRKADKKGTTENDRETTLNEVILDMAGRSAMADLKDEYMSLSQQAVNNDKLFGKPVHIDEDIELHMFETSYKFLAFNQFIYDASVELLDCGNLFSEATFYLRDTVLVVKHDSKWLVFYYEKMESTRAAGVAVLLKQNDFIQGIWRPNAAVIETPSL